MGDEALTAALARLTRLEGEMEAVRTGLLVMLGNLAVSEPGRASRLAGLVEARAASLRNSSPATPQTLVASSETEKLAMLMRDVLSETHRG